MVNGVYRMQYGHSRLKKCQLGPEFNHFSQGPYGDSKHPAYSALSLVDADNAEQHAHGSEERTYAQGQLDQSYISDFLLGARAHWLPIEVSIRTL